MIKDDKIIIKYKNALFDEYYTYLDVINHLNGTIPDFAEGLGFDIPKNISFDYPEFCKKFLIILRDKHQEKSDLTNQDVIYKIFEQMIFEKIIENIEEV
jgi:hypothetical protein